MFRRAENRLEGGQVATGCFHAPCVRSKPRSRCRPFTRDLSLPTAIPGRKATGTAIHSASRVVCGTELSAFRPRCFLADWRRRLESSAVCCQNSIGRSICCTAKCRGQMPLALTGSISANRPN